MLGEAQSGGLNDEQRRWYAEFLDANELGLALEMLADWLGEAARPVSDGDRVEMMALAEEMGNEPRVASPLSLCPRAR